MPLLSSLWSPSSLKILPLNIKKFNKDLVVLFFLFFEINILLSKKAAYFTVSIRDSKDICSLLRSCLISNDVQLLHDDEWVQSCVQQH